MILTYSVGLIDTLWPIALVLLVSFLFYRFRDQIKESHWRKTIPLILLIIMLTTEGHFLEKFAKIPFVPLSETFSGFPLHLCSTSAVLVLLYLGFKKEIFLDLLIFQGIIGAMVTFVFPSVTDAPTTYEYWKFFISHSILFLTPAFFMIVEGKRVERKHLFIGLIAIHIIAFFAVVVNLSFHEHYMYLTPNSADNLFSFIPIHTTFPFLDNLLGCIIFGEILVAVVYPLFYFIYKFLQGDYKKA